MDDQVKQATLVPLAKATADSCGSKAAKCAQLAVFAEGKGSFKTAAGVCLPFGSMELALKVKLSLLFPSHAQSDIKEAVEEWPGAIKFCPGWIHGACTQGKARLQVFLPLRGRQRQPDQERNHAIASCLIMPCERQRAMSGPSQAASYLSARL